MNRLIYIFIFLLCSGVSNANPKFIDILDTSSIELNNLGRFEDIKCIGDTCYIFANDRSGNARILRSFDSGDNWEIAWQDTIRENTSRPAQVGDISYGGRIGYGTLKSEMMLSNDYGESFKSIKTGFSTLNWPRNLRIIGDTIYYTNGGFLYRSFDFGTSWDTLMNTGSPITDLTIKGDSIYMLSYVEPLVYDEMNMWLSHNKGEYWFISIPFAIDEGTSSNLFVLDKDNIWINTTKRIGIGDRQSIIIDYTSDLGKSWHNRLDVFVQEIPWGTRKIQMLNEKVGFSAGHQGLIGTYDNWKTWKYLPHKEGTYNNSQNKFMFTINYKNEIFFGSNTSHGVFKSKSISSVEYETESPSTFYTYRPYPNPANNMVTLPFDFLSSANLANMEIKLIDVSGRDVSQFADFNIRALNHYKAELEIKLDNIQRGIYFIQMTLNGTNKTSSFIKLN